MSYQERRLNNDSLEQIANSIYPDLGTDIERDPHRLNGILAVLNDGIKVEKFDSTQVVGTVLDSLGSLEVGRSPMSRFSHYEATIFASQLYTLFKLRQNSIPIHSRTQDILGQIPLFTPDDTPVEWIVDKQANSQQKLSAFVFHLSGGRDFNNAFADPYVLDILTQKGISKEELKELVKGNMQQKSGQISELVTLMVNEALNCVDGLNEYKFMDLDKAEGLIGALLNQENREAVLQALVFLTSYSVTIGSANVPPLIAISRELGAEIPKHESLTDFYLSEYWQKLLARVVIVTSGYGRTRELSDEVLSLAISDKSAGGLKILSIGGHLFETRELAGRLSARHSVGVLVNADKLSAKELTIEKAYDFMASGDTSSDTRGAVRSSTQLAYEQQVEHVLYDFENEADIWDSLYENERLSDIVASGFDLIICRYSVLPHGSDLGLYNALYDIFQTVNKKSGMVVLSGGYYPVPSLIDTVVLKFHKRRLAVEFVLIPTKDGDITGQYCREFFFEGEKPSSVIEDCNLFDRRELYDS